MNTNSLILASQGGKLMLHKIDPKLVEISGDVEYERSRAGTRILRTSEEQKGHDPELTEAG
jgi:hypothetical protein